jgi:hypothetical protein
VAQGQKSISTKTPNWEQQLESLARMGEEFIVTDVTSNSHRIRCGAVADAWEFQQQVDGNGILRFVKKKGRAEP